VLDLGIISLTFGLMVTFNVASIIGIIIAFVIYKRFM
jgi:hypothetical protein